MNAATKNEIAKVRAKVAAATTRAAKLDVIQASMANTIGNEIGEKCLGCCWDLAIVTEWETEAAAKKAAAFLTAKLGKKDARVDYDADLGWTASATM